jgi:PHD/YefM family antitoxin component YafN of YafNO toxin-antitoxin module
VVLARIVLVEASGKEHYIVDDEGKKRGVILGVEEYQQLVEDLHDLRVVAERRAGPRISKEDLLKELDRVDPSE